MKIIVRPCRWTGGPVGSCACSLLVFLAILFLPMPATGAPEGNWQVQITESALYDGNVLRYSDKYIERFRNREDAGRFHISRYDDLTFQTSLKITRSLDLFPALSSSIAGQIQYKRYTHNPVRNWYSVGLTIRQAVAERTIVILSYSYMPNFYVRHYRDEDWVAVYGYTAETFKPFEFSKDNVSLTTQYTIFTDTRVRATIAYARYFYNQHFTEYDSKDWSLGLNVTQPVHRRLNINVGYRYVNSNASGVDTPFETKENSDDADADFNEHEFRAGIEWRMPRLFGRPTNIEMGVQWDIRDYSSPHSPSMDPFHSGRRDYEYGIDLSYGVRVLPTLDVALAYSWSARSTRTSTSQNAVYLSDEKDYHQHQIGVELAYAFQP